MLFQPTFISPSLQWGIGNGTVDVANGIEFSWQVNGSSAMTSFEIIIYENNALSTQVYTTTEITTGCPFYGTNYAGDSQTFTYFVPAATLTSAGMSNGNDYKFTITQWWDVSSYVTQTSATAFQTRSTPTLSITAFATPLSSRTETFTATYTQAEDDGLNWVRWQIALTSDTANPFFDTEKIYGTSELQCTYDGFISGQQYAVRCIVQTENGVEISTGWEIFDVSYSTNTLEGVVDAKCACKHDAVKLSWDEVTYMPGVASGTYDILNGNLILPSGSAVSWSAVNGNALSLDPPWTLFYKTRVRTTGNNTDWLLITTADGSLSFRRSSGYVFIRINGSVAGYALIADNDELTACITKDAAYLYIANYGGGLYPDSSLEPDVNLYPEDDVLLSSTSITIPLTYTQSPITSVTLNGAQDVDYVQIESGDADGTIISSVLDGTYTPNASGSTLFLVTFDYGLNAGNLNATSDTLIGYAVYRRQGSSGTIQHIVDVGISDVEVYDFGAGSQTDYTYYVFPIGENTYIAEPLVSNEIYPVFWDWVILQCSQRQDGTYKVESEFKFANNVSSGTITNNNTPMVANNFTKYPTVQLAPQNYMSGTLSALIGAIDYTDNSYSDSIALRDAIFNLSTTTDALFLKNRKGDVMQIRISAPITMATSDNTVGQIQTTSIPWVQINDASEMPIVALPGDGVLA